MLLFCLSFIYKFAVCHNTFIAMKKGLLFILLLLTLASLQAQMRLDELSGKYDSIYMKYRAHKDTVSVNTWLNVMRSNAYLEDLMRIDSMIKKQIRHTSSSDSVIRELKSRLNAEQEENSKLTGIIDNRTHELEFYQNMFYFLIAVVAIVMILLVIMVFLFQKANKSKLDNQSEIKKYYTELHAARNELDQAREIENQLASEVNKITRQLNTKLDEATQMNRALEDEKLMLNNQILEITKAYDLELTKRQELEHELSEKTQFQPDSKAVKTIEELTEKLQSMTDANDKLARDLEKLKAQKTEDTDTPGQIDKLKSEMAIEKKARKEAEDQLASLIQSVKDISKNY
jgi:cbb3-type cytochrome oxidase subunit 3